MNTKDFDVLKISKLGMGNMRLPAKCTQHCPQSIAIPDLMKELAKALEV